MSTLEKKVKNYEQEEYENRRQDRVREVIIDGLAVLKIVKHCNENLPTMVAGSLLGLDVDGVLDVLPGGIHEKVSFGCRFYHVLVRSSPGTQGRLFDL